MNIKIVSAGASGRRLMTQEALDAIETADIIMGAGRLVKEYGGVDMVSPLDIREYLKTHPCENAVILVTGDAGFFSLAKLVLQIFPEAQVIPGISSVVYLAAKAGISWEDGEFVSMHGKSANPVISVYMNSKVFFLTDKQNTPQSICKKLTEYGMGDVLVTVGERLSCHDEKITHMTAAKASRTEFSYMSVVLAKNPRAIKYIPACIPDDEFIRGKAPMTKSEVRSAVCAKLDIRRDGTVWDIGSGTGSVSIEMAYRCPSGQVWAVERDSDALELLRRNMHKFKTDNICPISGSTVEKIDSLPDPESVFIGGTGGDTKDILKKVFGRKPRNVVMTAVSLNTVSTVTELMESGEIPGGEISQISVTRTKKAGKHMMLSAENPVFIFEWRGLI